MIKIKIIKLIIVLCIFSLSACLSDDGNEIGIAGHLQDELGNPLTDVAISYRTSSQSVQTDSLGGFNINKPRTLFISFKKAGYGTLSTQINNFSEAAYYDFKKITLNKISNLAPYKDVALQTDTSFKPLKIAGKVLNSFEEPLKNANISLTDSTITSYTMINDGDFNFRIYDCQISIAKDGFRKLLIALPYYEKMSKKITLLENTAKKGIYLLKAGKYIALPQTKLVYKSEEKIGSRLWGGSFGYNVTDFFYPKDTKIFTIDNDATVRFIIFEPPFCSNLFAVQNADGYLCTADYKNSTSPFPSSKKELLPIYEIYPPKYSKDSFDSPKIIDFKPSHKNLNYVFVNSKTKRGYYFTY